LTPPPPVFRLPACPVGSGRTSCPVVIVVLACSFYHALPASIIRETGFVWKLQTSTDAGEHGCGGRQRLMHVQQVCCGVVSLWVTHLCTPRCLFSH